MEDRETPRMSKYGESKMTRIMMATVPHVTSGSGKFQADGFLFDRVYHEGLAETFRHRQWQQTVSSESDVDVCTFILMWP